MPEKRGKKRTLKLITDEENEEDFFFGRKKAYCNRFYANLLKGYDQGKKTVRIQFKKDINRFQDEEISVKIQHKKRMEKFSLIVKGNGTEKRKEKRETEYKVNEKYFNIFESVEGDFLEDFVASFNLNGYDLKKTYLDLAKIYCGLKLEKMGSDNLAKMVERYESVQATNSENLDVARNNLINELFVTFNVFTKEEVIKNENVKGDERVGDFLDEVEEEDAEETEEEEEEGFEEAQEEIEDRDEAEGIFGFLGLKSDDTMVNVNDETKKQKRIASLVMPEETKFAHIENSNTLVFTNVFQATITLEHPTNIKPTLLKNDTKFETEKSRLSALKANQDTAKRDILKAIQSVEKFRDENKGLLGYLDDKENIRSLYFECKAGEFDFDCEYVDFLLKIFSIFFPRESLKVRGLRRRLLFQGNGQLDYLNVGHRPEKKVESLWDNEKGVRGFDDHQLIYRKPDEVDMRERPDYIRRPEFKKFIKESKDPELIKAFTLFDMALLKNNSVLKLLSMYTEESVLALASHYVRENSQSYITFYQFLQALSTIGSTKVEDLRPDEETFCNMTLDLLKTYEGKRSNLNREMNDKLTYILEPFRTMLREEGIMAFDSVADIIEEMKTIQNYEDPNKVFNVLTTQLAMFVKPIGEKKIKEGLFRIHYLTSQYFKQIKDKYDKRDIFSIIKEKESKNENFDDILNYLTTYLDEDFNYDEVKNAFQITRNINEVDKRHEKFWLTLTKSENLIEFYSQVLKIQPKYHDPNLTNTFNDQKPFNFLYHSKSLQNQCISILENMVMYNISNFSEDHELIRRTKRADEVDFLFVLLSDMFNLKFSFKNEFKYLDENANVKEIREMYNNEVQVVAHFQNLLFSQQEADEKQSEVFDHRSIFYNFFANVFKMVKEYCMMMFLFPEFQGKDEESLDNMVDLPYTFAKKYNLIFFADNLNLIYSAQNVLSMHTPSICKVNVSAIAEAIRENLFLTDNTAFVNRYADENYFLEPVKRSINPNINIVAFFFSLSGKELNSLINKEMKKYKKGSVLSIKDNKEMIMQILENARNKNSKFGKNISSLRNVDNFKSNGIFHNVFPMKDKIEISQRRINPDGIKYYNNYIKKKTNPFFTDKHNGLLKAMASFFLLFFNMDFSKISIGSLMAAPMLEGLEEKLMYNKIEFIFPHIRPVFENALEQNENEIYLWRFDDIKPDTDTREGMRRIVSVQPLNNFASRVFLNVSKMYFAELSKKSSPDARKSDLILNDLKDDESGIYEKYIGISHIRSRLIEVLEQENDEQRDVDDVLSFTILALRLLSEKKKDCVSEDFYQADDYQFGMTFFANLFLE